MAEVLRALLDDALARDDGTAAALAAIERTAGVVPEVPEWPDFLAEVRNRPTVEKLTELDDLLPPLAVAGALADSTILIAHLRGHRDATALLLDRRRAGPVLVSVLSRVEVQGWMRSDERRDVASLFGALDLVPVTDGIATRAAAHARRYRRSHAAIDVTDYVIAASAQERDADLLTLNVKHFPMFKGLPRRVLMETR